MGTMVYGMMVSLGEMATLFPVAGAFTHYATRFVDPALGFVSIFLYPSRTPHRRIADLAPKTWNLGSASQLVCAAYDSLCLAMPR